MAGNPHSSLFCPLVLVLHPLRIFNTQHDLAVPINRATPPWANGLHRIQNVNHVGMTHNPALADWVATRLIAGTNSGTGSSGGGPESGSGPAAAAGGDDSGAKSPNVAQIPSAYGRIPAGGLLEVPIVVDGTARELTVLGFAERAPTGLELVSPSGEVHSGTALPTGALWDGTAALTAKVARPEPGTWVARLAAPADKQSFIGGDVDSALRLVLSIADATPTVGEPIEVLARLKRRNKLSDVTVTAQVLDRDGIILQNLSFDQSGSKRYRTTWQPSASGPLTLRSLVTGRVKRRGRWTTFAREAALALMPVPAEGPAPQVVAEEIVDENLNGLIDGLALTVEYTPPEAGDYWLLGTLGSPVGDPIVTAGALLSGISATGQAELVFDGEAIRRGGADGPYQLTELRLVEVQTTGVVGDQRTPYETDTYLAIDFEGPLVQLTGGSTDLPEDLDLDGIYDRLSIGVEVRVAGAYSGTYSFNAQLRAADGTELQWYTGFAALDTEVSELEFEFGGAQLAAADGPYHLVNFSIHPYSDPASVHTQAEVHVTAPYQGCWFGTSSGGCPTPSSAFSLAKGVVTVEKRKQGKDRFMLKGRIDGVADLEVADVIVRLDGWFELLPAGSLTRKTRRGQPYWTYKNNRPGIRRLKVWPNRRGGYNYRVKAGKLDLDRLESPVLLGIELGSIYGRQYVTFKEKEKRSHWKYRAKP